MGILPLLVSFENPCVIFFRETGTTLLYFFLSIRQFHQHSVWLHLSVISSSGVCVCVCVCVCLCVSVCLCEASECNACHRKPTHWPENGRATGIDLGRPGYEPEPKSIFEP